jgi:hypothetical protein
LVAAGIGPSAAVNVPSVLFVEMTTKKRTADATRDGRNRTTDRGKPDDGTTTAANDGSNKAISTTAAMLVMAVIIVMTARHGGFWNVRCHHDQRHQGESDFASHNASPRTVHKNAYPSVWLRE